MDGQIIREFVEREIERLDKLKKTYPNNIPNDVCKHAFIRGFSIENSFEPNEGEYNYLFKTNFEKVYVWTYKKNTYSALVSEIIDDVRTMQYWKTLVHIISLAIRFTSAYEKTLGNDLPEYKWMYYFDPEHCNIDDIVFYELSDYESRNMSAGQVIKLTDLAEMASIIELLIRDDKAYTALSMVVSAFNAHYCCLICELSDAPWHDHLTEEHEIWKQIENLPNLEMAIVQSCRAVESILGEPPNRQRAGRVYSHKQHWIETTGINADDCYEKAGITYLDFYYSLFFDLRNPSAHSYGNIHYDLRRKRAVEAQCFAAIIVKAYIMKQMIENEDAKKLLEFNYQLLDRVSEDMSTSLTKK